MIVSDNQKHKIIRDRVEIYKDFTLSLLYYIDKYYLDKKSLSEDNDIYNHFIWCYNKACSDFLIENIDFRENDELIDYFYTYYYSLYYVNDNDDLNIDKHSEIWFDIFNITTQNNKNTFEILVALYGMFDKSINIEKNILELV